jgi:hypothetical protein
VALADEQTVPHRVSSAAARMSQLGLILEIRSRPSDSTATDPCKGSLQQQRLVSVSRCGALGALMRKADAGA